MSLVKSPTMTENKLAGPSPFELAAQNAPSHAEVLLMRRAQDANMREVRRLTNLLLKLKREERQRPAREASEGPRVPHDVPDNKGS